MNKINCVIVEDEVPAAQELKYILEQHKELSIKATAYDGNNGMKIIKEIEPEVVFLDINMPGINGLELARQIKEFKESIAIIFVTAYEQHALEAFEVEALDYVLKPFDEIRIDKTVDRVVHKYSFSKPELDIALKMNEIITRLTEEDKTAKKVPCEHNGKIVLIDIKDIYYCYIEGEKVYVKTIDQKYSAIFNLCKLEEKTKFFRAHRSFLVNLNKVKEMFSWFNGSYKVVMDDIDKTEIPVSRNNVKKLRNLLDI